MFVWLGFITCLYFKVFSSFLSLEEKTKTVIKKLNIWKVERSAGYLWLQSERQDRDHYLKFSWIFFFFTAAVTGINTFLKLVM